MGLLISLQDFAEDPKPAADLPIPVEEQPGYAEGFAAGQAVLLAEADRVDQAVAAALDDLAFHFAEARQAVLQNLVPLMEAIATQIVPQSVDPLFRRQVLDILTEAARRDSRQPVTLVLHPDQVAPLQAILDRTGHTDVAVCGDPDNALHMALIRQGEVETALDTASLADQLTKILTDYSTLTQQKKADHG